MATIGNPRPDGRKSRVMSTVSRQRAGEAAQQARPNQTNRQERPNAPATPAKGKETAQQQSTAQVAQQSPEQVAKQAAREAAQQAAQQARQQAANDAASKRSFTAAFTALKQTRLFRNLKKGGAGKKYAPGLIGLFEDFLDVAYDHQKARAYLGDESEEGNFGRAKREALLLQHLEGMGGSPLHLVRYLNALLAMDRERDFKHYIVDQIRPRLDSVASRMGELPTIERRLVAALVARASYQVGARSADHFSNLLSAAGAAEAAHWAESSDRPAGRAQALTESLRVAASPAYRAALITAGRESLKKLAGDTVGLPPDELHRTWVWLLRACETLEFEALQPVAESVVAGIMAKGNTAALGVLPGVLTPALRAVPGGGSLVVQLIVNLTGRGDVKSASLLVEMLRGVINQARANCQQLVIALRDLEAANPAGGGNRDGLLRQLESRGALLVWLIPACSRVLEKGPGLPQGSTTVLTESLLALATLHVLGATPSGQRLLYRTLLAQERGRETFLSTLPRVALTLAQPTLAQTLAEAGLASGHFQFGGRPFLERVALHTGRSLAVPLLTRNRKGDIATGKALLRSMIRNNAALFGLTADGAYLAAEALETQRDKPTLVPMKKTLYRLAKVRKKNALGQHPNAIEPFQDLVTALAASSLRSDGRTSGKLSVHEVSAQGRRKNTSAELHVDMQEFNRR
jgi:hypothetical protein